MSIFLSSWFQRSTLAITKELETLYELEKQRELTALFASMQADLYKNSIPWDALDTYKDSTTARLCLPGMQPQLLPLFIECTTKIKTTKTEIFKNCTTTFALPSFKKETKKSFFSYKSLIKKWTNE